MADILERIQNPLARSITSALMGASAATIVVGGLLGFAPLEGRKHRLSTYATLLGAGAGALFGVTVKPTPAKGRSTPQAVAELKTLSSSWTGWRNFVVIRKVPESREITSFYLKPQDGQSIPGFVPGQFLTIQLDIPGQARPVIRTYSLSDYAEHPDYYRFSIKREGAPRGQDVPPGIASNFMHDHIQEGAIIPAKPPAGKFVLDVSSDRPAVLISNGVGITPMISMAKAAIAQNPKRLVWFLHGARDGSFHAFQEAALAIAPNIPNFHVHYRYSRPRPEDDGGYQDTGYVDIDLVKSLVAPALQQRSDSADAEYFLCGSPSFMDSLRSGLAAWGVSENDVHFESFSKPRPKATAEATATVADGAVAAGGAVATAEVVFAQSGKTATWSAGDGTLLEFAEEQGLEPAFSCRAGICLTCMCRLEAGEVAYEEPPTGTPDEGSVLICVSKPGTSKVVLDL
ncbi:MAG: 2Fe-2S iron-sulfur cluster binding domain-containing protein [Leptolyngbya sp. SIO1D8]|nr:2Fe-2S iron-sulfur cluster binding domain-containing protein [Leptolyngbya sp. SIO1D8]